ncbi:hypothetical protein ACFPES_17305 [Paenibacillus sp. GCM10023248]|nr:hypothetical protein [Paenibacillus sp. MAHUQ-63]
MVYLKKSSLDRMNLLLTVTDAVGAKRHVRISRKCAELYQLALEQTRYIVDEGCPSKPSIRDLRASDDLIKVSMHDFIGNRCLITQMDCVILRTIYMRLRRLAEKFAAPELTYMTAMTYRSEQFAHA